MCVIGIISRARKDGVQIAGARSWCLAEIRRRVRRNTTAVARRVSLSKKRRTGVRSTAEGYAAENALIVTW